MTEVEVTAKYEILPYLESSLGTCTKKPRTKPLNPGSSNEGKSKGF